MPEDDAAPARLPETVVLEEDRDDVVRRALPRLIVGHAVVLTSLCVVVLLASGADGATWGRILALDLVLLVLTVLLRFDVWALQLGRRVRYEISATTFTAYRGDRVVVSFALDDVREWTDCRSATTRRYWTGSGYFRTLALPGSEVLATYTFTLGATQDRWAPFTEVSPPALFRWEDRGGLEDVSGLLRGRLGEPWNTVG